MSKLVKGSNGKTRPLKQVTEPPAEAAADRYLVWRFGRLDFDGKFACHTLSGRDVPELEQELETFQKVPIWCLRHKKWLKFIPATEMTAEGQTRLAEVNEQEDGLWQLHLHRYKWRIWGYFEEPQFFFLWWDSEHGVATGKSRNRRSR